MLLLLGPGCSLGRVPEEALYGRWSLLEGDLEHRIVLAKSGACRVDGAEGVWKYDGGVLRVDFVDLPPRAPARTRSARGDAAQILSLEGEELRWRHGRLRTVQVLRRAQPKRR